MESGAKIEIGESLVYSWLRHVQGCAVAQMSWKPSPTWAVAKGRELEEAFQVIRSFASDAIGVQIFKKGEFSQFIRQAEIDVLGTSRGGDSAAPRAIAVDSAFHENGLQYGNPDETVGRVLEKLIRAAFAIDAYLNVAEAKVIFATPKMAEAVRERVQRQLAVLERRLMEQRSSAMPRLHFRIIANADFADEILRPVMDKLGSVADTSELFMRAQQLARLCEATPRHRHTSIDTNFPDPGARSHPTSATSEEAVRIGEHVRAAMAQLAASGQLTDRIVGDLLDPRYCKRKFNLGLPFLKAIDRGLSRQSQRIDRNGYSRYWSRPLRVGEHEFLMCSQWFVGQRGVFDSWVREVGRSSGQPQMAAAHRDHVRP
jgi:hypothetical protein